MQSIRESKNIFIRKDYKVDIHMYLYWGVETRQADYKIVHLANSHVHIVHA